MPSAPRRSADRALLRDRPAKSKAVKQAAVLSPDEIAAMLEAASPRDAALVALMGAGACRVGEATLLTWEDVDGCSVTIPGGATKSGCGRAFTLPPTACRYLRAWRELCPATRKGWIFPGRAGQPLSIRAAQVAITALADRLGLEGVSSHSLRRSAITAAADAGLSLKTVAEVSGHQSLSSLQRYIDGRTARTQAEAARGLLFGEG
jgi:integrase/recombinase XerD